MKSVLFISRSASESLGGMQEYTRTLSQALLRQSDISVTLCLHRGRLFTLPLFFLRAFFHTLFFRGHTVCMADGVMSLLFLPLSLFRPSLRRVSIVHGLDITWSFFPYRFLLRRSLQSAHAIVAVSKFTLTLLHDLCRCSSSQTAVVIPCPLPITHGQPFKRTNPDTPTLLLLGRLVPRKGFVWFLQSVVPLLLSEFPDLRVLIAGNGPDHSRIQQILSLSSLPSNISLLGVVSQEEKCRLLSTSSLLVMPNIEKKDDPEGFGIVCIEAAHAGLPTVSARLQGLQDAVTEGVTGYFFAPESPQDCARVILAALSHSWDCASMMNEVRSCFDSDSIASRFVHEVF